ncbi:RNB domain-containing ribonuclease [Granulosicoccaceae sp. 1_MG-2023]|nr:RNB domain-containing ribonuclease [Granulosicoccaceae sp. 1_MG-2023]
MTDSQITHSPVAYFQLLPDGRGQRLFRGGDSEPVRLALPPDTDAGSGDILIREGDSLHCIARDGSVQARLYRLLDEAGLDPAWSAAALRETAQWQAAPGIDDPALQDLTGLAFVTIDNPASRDLDQAMYLCREDDGYRVVYALADASYYAPVGSALFRESVQRGASYYLPGFSVPMLPPALSEDLVSLNAGVARRAVVIDIRLDGDARVRSTALIRARIRSRAKLSYPGVQALHDDPASSPLRGQDYTDTLMLLREVGEKRIARARERNVVQFERLSAEVTPCPQENRLELRRGERVECENWNEQISLLCNHQGAVMLAQALGNPQIQPVFRIHRAPEAQRLRQFSAMLDGLIDLHKLDPALWRWRWRDGEQGPRETLAAYLRRLPRSGPTQAVFETISHQMRMLNSASEFTAEYGGHHALQLDGYARLSSPMREVAGIFTHKELAELCFDGVEPQAPAVDLSLRDEVVAAANRARQKQKWLDREVFRLAIHDLLVGDLDLAPAARPPRQGTVVEIRRSGAMVRLDSPPVVIKVYREALEQALGVVLTADTAATVLQEDKPGGRVVIGLGQRITLSTHAFEENRGHWILLPAATGN